MNKIKYGYMRKLHTGKYELGISLGFNSEGKRIRKYRNVEAENEEDAKNQFMLFYLEYKNVKLRNLKTKKLRQKLKENLELFCKINCNKNICKENDCMVYKFYMFQYNKVLEDYEF